MEAKSPHGHGIYIHGLRWTAAVYGWPVYMKQWPAAVANAGEVAQGALWWSGDAAKGLNGFTGARRISAGAQFYGG